MANESVAKRGRAGVRHHFRNELLRLRLWLAPLKHVSTIRRSFIIINHLLFPPLIAICVYIHWLVSFRLNESIDLFIGLGYRIFFEVSVGKIVLVCVADPSYSSWGCDGARWFGGLPKTERIFPWAQFANQLWIGHEPISNGQGFVGIGHAISVPLWMLFVATTAWAIANPFLAARKMEAIRLELGECCFHCGYDLRGIARHCPECGMEIVNWESRKNGPA